MVRQIDYQVQDLLRQLVLIGRMAQDFLSRACDESIPLHRRNSFLDRQPEFESLQQKVEDLALKLAVLQQPIGADARLILMAPKIAQEYGRIAKHAQNLTREQCAECECVPRDFPMYLSIMSEVVQKMVAASIELLISRNIENLDELQVLEAEVNTLRDRINREVMSNIAVTPASIDCLLKILNSSRELERAGDEALRVAYEAHYVVKGTALNHARHSDQN